MVMNPLPFMGLQATQKDGGGINQMGFAMVIAASMVVMTMFQQFLFKHFGTYLERSIRRIVSSMDPYVQIKFPDDTIDGGGPKNHEAYATIETYLSSKCSTQAPRLKANSLRDISSPVLCVDDGEGVSDNYGNTKVWWHLGSEDSSDVYRSRKKKYYALTFRKSDREIIVGEYLRQVMREGKAAEAKNRQLKLFSSSSGEGGTHWNYIKEFDHPATFKSVAMEESKKQDIIDDLINFSNAREYYRGIGKPWKRGYLLYGPPGTGKSTMIAAIANLLCYDVYDLELTAIISNSALKKLLNRVPCNSILVIEDIDCSSKITVQRDLQGSETTHKQGKKKNGDAENNVTLSGLLNCIDGLFSANEGGRLVVFTTNRVEDLDVALIRRGRMDKHIEMSYCGFAAFKVLAKNYLGVEDHEMFGKIEELLEEVEITPADVAESLIANSAVGDGGGGGAAADGCLKNLIAVLEKKVEENSKWSETDEKTEAEEAPPVENHGRENGDVAVAVVNENGHAN